MGPLNQLGQLHQLHCFQNHLKTIIVSHWPVL